MTLSQLMADEPKTPVSLSIEASLRYMTVAERSKLHLDIEMHRMTLWCYVYKYMIEKGSLAEFSKNAADSAIHAFEQTFRPTTG